MKQTIERYEQIKQRIIDAEKRFGREPGSVQLLAVSKTKPVTEIESLYSVGQHAFGENYLQEACEKIEEMAGKGVEWHFIGPLQSNKTKQIAANFSWVHSVDRLKLAQRLSEQRPIELPALNICIQVNLSEEESKSGTTLQALPELAKAIDLLPNVQLRGLMAIPQVSQDMSEQRACFKMLREAKQSLCKMGMELDTLSMGMSGDLEAAIAEGSTIIRVGTALFGAREQRS